jgi:tetratricopeptide (TPR) repeat protein
LLAEGFTDLDPSHPLGGPDGGKDAVAHRDGFTWIMAAYFPRGQQSFATIKRKFMADFRGVRRNHAKGMVFVTNQELALSQRTELDTGVDGATEIYHLERVTTVLDQPRMAAIKRQFLAIDIHPVGVAEINGRMFQVEHGNQNITIGSSVRPVAVAVPIVGDTDVFVGRQQELLTLMEKLRPHEDTQDATVVSVVAGMGGVGKTALVRQVAGQATDWFAGGAIWIDMHGYETGRSVDPAQVFGPLLRALRVPGNEIPPQVGEQAAHYHRLLADLAEQQRRVLLVVDNVSATDQAIDLMPRQRAHRAMVTTRDTLNLTPATIVTLDVLSDAEAVDLLAEAMHDRRADDHRVVDHPADVAVVAQLCDRLPLAVRIVVGILGDEPGLSLADFADELRGARMDALSYGDQAVAASFDLSWRHLRSRHPEAASLLRLLTLNPGPDLSIDTCAALIGVSPILARPRLRVLLQAHLVQHRQDRWQMHDLIRLHTQTQKVEDDLTAVQDRLIAHYWSTVVAADTHLQDLPEQTPLDRFTGRDAALVWLTTERSNLIAVAEHAASIADHALSFNFSSVLSKFLQSQRYDIDALNMARQAVNAAQHLDSPTHRGVALNNLGLALLNLRRFEGALNVFEQAASFFQIAGDHNQEWLMLHNLGLALRQLGRLDEAMTLGRHAVVRAKESGDRYWEALAESNLGAIQHDGGNDHEAIVIFRKVITTFQEIGDREGEAKAWISLGQAWMMVHPYDDVTDEYQRAADLFQEIGDRHGKGRALNNLGNACLGLGCYKRAIEAYRAAVTLFQETGDRYEEGRTLHNLALTLADAGQEAEAQESWSQAINALNDSGSRQLAEQATRFIRADE